MITTPMMQQYKQIKEACPNALLLFRLGDFYELFYEDALVAASLLNIVLTRRRAKETNVPMCGIPYHALDRYVPKLLEEGYRVAICEQMEKPSHKKKVVKREVVRVLSRGTAQDIGVGDEKENQFVMGLHLSVRGAGVVLADVGTGDLKLGFGRAEDLGYYLESFQPKEVVLSQAAEEKVRQHFQDKMPPCQKWSEISEARARQKIEEALPVSSHTIGVERFPEVQQALAMTLDYLESMEKRSCRHFLAPVWLKPESHLLIDETTRKHLQLFPDPSLTKEESLFGVLDRTCTTMGSRLLREWFLFPLLKKVAIEERLNAVTEGKEKWSATESIRRQLSSLYDLARIASRISLNRIAPRQLVQLRATLRQADKIREALLQFRSKLMQQAVQEMDVREVTQHLVKWLQEEPGASLEEGNVIGDEVDEELKLWRSKRREIEQAFLAIEQKEREKTGIRSLKVGFTQVFGYYIEISKPNLSRVPPSYKRKQTMAAAERFVTADLLLLQSEWVDVGEKAREREDLLYQQLVQELAKYVPALQVAARAIALCDVLLTFAVVALDNDYVQPILRTDDKLILEGCRHPILEKQLADPFVDNDLFLDRGSSQLWLITGPNMSGKSTFLRQVALNVFLAQIGSFLPARRAEIGIVDRIFSRVGAQDEITRGRSTFLVEMEETAHLLRHLTARSLLILDEVGRGTGTYDGLSLAQAVIEYLCQVPEKPRTLFATHYLELTALEQRFPSLQNYTVFVREREGKVNFLHKIVKGSADKSYGIYVAKMAGVPQSVLDRAGEILKEKESKSLSSHPTTAQPPLFAQRASPYEAIIQQLRQLEIERLTPLDAFSFLAKIVARAKMDETEK